MLSKIVCFFRHQSENLLTKTATQNMTKFQLPFSPAVHYIFSQRCKRRLYADKIELQNLDCLFYWLLLIGFEIWA